MPVNSRTLVCLVSKILEPNRMFFCEQYCNIIMQCCNIDVHVARMFRDRLTSCRSNITLFLNVYYKIQGKFLLQTCNTCILN